MAVTIDSKMVAQLREKTGAGMMDCKKALTEAEGDVEKAVEILRTKGMATAEKKAGRATKDGSVASYISEDGKTGLLMELNCETDFVACTDQFQGLLKGLMQQAIDKKFENKDQFPKEEITAFIAKLGENTSVGNFARFSVEGNGLIGGYMHPSPKPGIHKLGVLIQLETGAAVAANDEALNALIRDIAMQVASQRPDYVCKDEVPADILQKEKEIYMEQAKQEGKPEKILEKIADGKLHKFYSMVCLVDQSFIKDDKMTVGQMMEAKAKELGYSIKIVRFARFKVGEAA